MAEQGDTVLIVEDSVHNRNILKYLFEQLDFKVLTASSGEEGLAELKKIDASQLALVVSDIMMPEMNGIKFIQKMRENQDFLNTHVMMVTASSDKKYILEAKELKISAYLLKPLSASKIVDCLRTTFPQRSFKDIKVGT